MGKKKAKRSKMIKIASRNLKNVISNDSYVRGLNNLGNTCFFNSCLQALNAVIQCDNIVAEGGTLLGSNGKVHSNFFQTLSCLQTASSRSTYNPGMLLNEIGKYAPHFKNRRQHDSHELLLALLSILSDEVMEGDECSSGGKREKCHYEDDPFLSLFSGQYGSIVTCSNCSFRSCSLQHCFDTSLQIPGSSHLLAPSRLSYSSKILKRGDVKGGEHVRDTSSGVLKVGDEIGGDISPSAPSDGSMVSSDDGSRHAAVICGIIDDLVRTVISDASRTHAPKGDDQELHDINILEPAVRRNKLSGRTEEVSLYSCLLDYTSPEMLHVAEGNGYLCSGCSGGIGGRESVKRDAQKRLLLVSAPLVLTLHLKRLLPGGKCSKYVSFPLVLSIEDFMGKLVDSRTQNGGSRPVTGAVEHSDNRCVGPEDDGSGLIIYQYALYSVVVHQGGATGGHYIAYTRVGNIWYYTSDTVSRTATEEEVLKTEAYMLFYKKETYSARRDKESHGDRTEEEKLVSGEDAKENTGVNDRQGEAGSAMTTEEDVKALARCCGVDGLETVAPPMVPTSTDIRWAKSLKPPELRRELLARGLSVQGCKKELLVRLLEAPSN